LAAKSDEPLSDIDQLNQEIRRIQAIIDSPGRRKMRRSPVPGVRAPTPRNAATLIIVDRASGAPRVLMGKRHGALAFMPGALVFPGGSVDRGDGDIAAAHRLPLATERKILDNMRGRPSPRGAHALGMAAIREVAEETGILIGERGRARIIGHRDWQLFDRHGVSPSLSGFNLLARAITPPGAPRRFDTWFFMVESSAICHVPESGFEPSGELEALAWISPEDAIAGPTREITRVVLVELINRLNAGDTADPECPSPFYRAIRNHFRKSLL
jgi:8-oxo-dGTP pyrophosphatase MutT (NUDIX family)